MSSTNQGLKQIFDLRLQLEQLSEQIERGPRQIAARQKTVDAKKHELEELRTKLKQAKVAADQKGLQLKTNESRIRDLEGKLNEVSTNREYAALGTQIAADKMANSVLEDEIIEALEQIDGNQRDIKAFELELKDVEAEFAVFVDSIKQKEPDLQSRATDINAKIVEAEKIIPGDIAPLYRRLVQTYGARGLAPVSSKSCGECYVGLTNQALVELKSGKLKFCTCGRLLFFAE